MIVTENIQKKVWLKKNRFCVKVDTFRGIVIIAIMASGKLLSLL